MLLRAASSLASSTSTQHAPMPLGFLACRELLPGGRYLFDIGQTSDSLSLAMVLTTILTTIGFVHRNTTMCKSLNFKENWTSRDVFGHAADVWGQGVAVVDRLRLAEDRVRPEVSQWC